MEVHVHSEEMCCGLNRLDLVLLLPIGEDAYRLLPTCIAYGISILARGAVRLNRYVKDPTLFREFTEPLGKISSK